MMNIRLVAAITACALAVTVTVTGIVAPRANAQGAMTHTSPSASAMHSKKHMMHHGKTMAMHHGSMAHGDKKDMMADHKTMMAH